MNLKHIAEEFQMAGLQPVPLRENKAPNLPQGYGHNVKWIPEIINKFDDVHTKKIGVVCGDVSGHFYCIDFDAHNHENIKEIFYDYGNNDFFRQMIQYNMITIAKTMRGGFHVYFRTDFPLQKKTLAKWETGAPMIELLGRGVYVVVPPSEGYQIIRGANITELKALPDTHVNFLIEQCYKYNRDINNVSFDTGSEIQDKRKTWPDRWSDDTPEGIYNNTEGDNAKKILINHGWQKLEKKGRDGLEYWVRPGKGANEGISATWGFRNNMFYVFSSNAEPFKQNTAYTPFKILTLLEYNGDWKKAKQDLREIYNLKDNVQLPKFDELKVLEVDFPIDVLPDNFQAFIYATEQTLGFNKDFLACSMLSACSSIIGNAIKIKIKEGYIDSAMLWVAIVGARGTTKTHPLRLVFDPITKIDRAHAEAYKEALINYKKSTEETKVKPKFHQIKVENATVEAIHQILEWNPNGIVVFKDELAAFFNEFNKYNNGKGDAQFFLECFNNSDYKVIRKTAEPIILNNIFINIIGTIQDEVLDEVALKNRETGLMDRFLFTRSETKAKPLPKIDLDREYTEWWYSFIGGMYNEIRAYNASYKDALLLYLSEDGREEMYRINRKYTDIKNSEDTLPVMKNYYSKLDTYIKRIALILCVIEHFSKSDELVVTDKHFKAAERICDYFAATSQNIFVDSINRKEQEEVMNSLKGKTKVQKIKHLQEIGYSVDDIAKLLGVTKRAIYKYI